MREVLRVFTVISTSCVCFLLISYEFELPFVVQDYFAQLGFSALALPITTINDFPMAEFINPNPQVRALGLTLVFSGGSLFALSWFVLTVMAFGELPTWGVACALSPPCAFLFGVKQDDEAKIYVVMHYIALMVLMTGICCLYLS